MMKLYSFLGMVFSLLISCKAIPVDDYHLQSMVYRDGPAYQRVQQEDPYDSYGKSLPKHEFEASDENPVIKEFDNRCKQLLT